MTWQLREEASVIVDFYQSRFVCLNVHIGEWESNIYSMININFRLEKLLFQTLR